MAPDQRLLPDIPGLTDSTLELDALFEVLSNDRRRFTLSCLQRYATPMALADVADELATWENDTRMSGSSTDGGRSVYIALYHVHVPKLEDTGLIEYSQERDTVILTEVGDEIASQLPSAMGNAMSDRWAFRNLTLTGGATYRV